MAQYKISQSPTKIAKPKLKSFFIPKGQTKVLNKKTVIGATIGAIVIITVGVVFALIKLRGQVQPLHGVLPPLAKHTPTTNTKGNYTYVITSGDISTVNNAVTNRDASLLGSYFASKVHVKVVGSGIDESLDFADASNIINSGLNGATNPWNFHVPASDLADWQNGPLGSFFSGNDLVGISSNNIVISIVFDNTGQITGVLIAPESDLTNPPSDGSGSNDGNSGPSNDIPTPADATD